MKRKLLWSVLLQLAKQVYAELKQNLFIIKMYFLRYDLECEAYFSCTTHLDTPHMT